jgi:hypothetical protein
MRAVLRSVVVVAFVVATWDAIAGGRKVMVLPLDGNADPALRAKLTQIVTKAARANGGEVSTGNTTFAETAAAVGCDPAAAPCGDTVLSTLGVDEVVFGTATTANDQTTVTVTRVVKGSMRKDQTFVLASGDPPDKAEGQLRPLYGGTVPVAGSGSAAVETGSSSAAGSDMMLGSGSAVAIGSGTETSFFDTRERKLGVGLVAGGSVAIVIGLALWASESSLQDEINNAPDTTPADITALRAKEDRASAYAWEGNILVALGLAAGGVGAYYLYTDHQNRSATATVAPIDHGTGAALVVEGRW